MDGDEVDRGFTLIEILLVIVVLGILATVVVLSAGNASGQAEDAACSIDRRQLTTAVSAYLAQPGITAITDSGGPEGYELTLVGDGLLGQTSQFHDLTADGAVVPESGSGC